MYNQYHESHRLHSVLSSDAILQFNGSERSITSRAKTYSFIIFCAKSSFTTFTSLMPLSIAIGIIKRSAD